MKQYKLEELARHVKFALSQANDTSAVTKTIGARVDDAAVNGLIRQASTDLDNAVRNLTQAKGAIGGIRQTF